MQWVEGQEVASGILKAEAKLFLSEGFLFLDHFISLEHELKGEVEASHFLSIYDCLR